MRIGVLSDTHGRLRQEAAERLEGVDCILHAGDFDNPDVLEALERIAPVYGVRGNNDWGAWAQHLPRMLRFSLGGVSFYMTHNRSDVPWSLPGVDVVICGHTHRYEKEKIMGRLWLNPGSCSYPRPFRSVPTMMLLDIGEDGTVAVLPVELPR